MKNFFHAAAFSIMCLCGTMYADSGNIQVALSVTKDQTTIQTATHDMTRLNKELAYWQKRADKYATSTNPIHVEQFQNATARVNELASQIDD